MNKHHRPRRLRMTDVLRQMVQETRLCPADLIYPVFVTRSNPGPIDAMPDVYRHTISEAVDIARRAADAGVSGLMLFGIPQSKDEHASRALSASGVISDTVEAIKNEGLNLVIITDVCVCSYISHGHCGIVHDDVVSNDETLPVLAQMAKIHADSGADIVAPSAMMDHQVHAIREKLDSSGHEHVSILSYSVKYASSFYGPFRDAAGGAPAFGDRKTHQMDSANRLEAMREVDLDIAEGADLLMVKPALAYLDVIHMISQHRPHIPLVAYNVSGEYSMVKAAAKQGYVDEASVVLEILTSIRRAGSKSVITYHALDVARWLQKS
ncbi:MAG: porphobilinogen synthase [Bacteroidetes bacterium]|nr:porphobilinogen synthase [Bacteroidota bacterium]MCY4234133.1 porphobilinogen synthase [Bacteroidota bacterium]